MTLVRFPINAVPFVKVPLATLLHDADVVHEHIQNGEMEPVRDLISTYGLPNEQHMNALRQFTMAIALRYALDEDALTRVRVFLRAYPGCLCRGGDVIRPVPRWEPPPPVLATAFNVPSIRRRIDTLIRRLERLSGHMDRIAVRSATILGLEKTFRLWTEFRLSVEEETWVVDPFRIPEGRGANATILGVLRDEALSKFRRNLVGTFPLSVSDYLCRRDWDDVVLLAFYLARGLSPWLEFLARSSGVRGVDPQRWFFYSEQVRSLLRSLQPPWGMRRDGNDWPRNCARFLRLMAADRVDQRIAALPLVERVEARFHRWRLRRREGGFL